MFLSFGRGKAVSSGYTVASASRFIVTPSAVNLQTRQFTARVSGTEATGTTGRKHRSNAEELIAKFPVIEVAGTKAICEGGGGVLGHPVQFIQLNTAHPGEPIACKYCGTRYAMKAGHHGHH